VKDIFEVKICGFSGRSILEAIEWLGGAGLHLTEDGNNLVYGGFINQAMRPPNEQSKLRVELNIRGKLHCPTFDQPCALRTPGAGFILHMRWTARLVICLDGHTAVSHGDQFENRLMPELRQCLRITETAKAEMDNFVRIGFLIGRADC